jgi:4-hydroxybenzoate polyprenyltransferase
MARPTVVVLLGFYAVVGLTQAGSDDPWLLLRALLLVVSFLVCCLVVNDLGDEAIDRVNLPGDPSRPVASGLCTRRLFGVVGVTAAAVALTTSAFISGMVVAVVTAGLLLAGVYSLAPIRLSARGAVASMVLPAIYVGVPYTVGILSVRAQLTSNDLILLGGLYVGFIGRILLKDFRDLRGDALFGKRTFLVRHGRRATCTSSALCWVAGAAVLVSVGGARPSYMAAQGLSAVAAVMLLRALASDRGPRRDERLISAIAIVGRGMIVILICHLSMINAGSSELLSGAVLAALGAMTLGQAWTMLTRGPVVRMVVPNLTLRPLFHR